MVSRCGIDDERGDLLTELTTGFEALLEKVEDLAARNAEFERQIKSYQAEGLPRFTPTKGSFTSSDPVEADKAPLESDIVIENDPRIVKGIQAYELLKVSMTGTVPLRRKRWRKISPNRTLVAPKPDLERDFTTQGTQGELKCPFSKKTHEIEDHPRKPDLQKTAHGNKTDHSSKQDDARTTSKSGNAMSKSASMNGSLSQCPIRFLRQIPAEEVAKYFEEHKHEIPRSHEVCVKRYQANAQSLKSLDAKYGNFVNMIKGLGEKHEPMLPSKTGLEDDEEGEDEVAEMDKKSIEKVEKWARNCVDGPGPLNEGLGGENDDDSDRTGHFERPLKEVRLGESPSRPWGIQVPYAEQLALNSDAAERESVAAPVPLPETQKDAQFGDPPKRAAGKCPFGHGNIAAPALEQESESKEERSDQKPEVQSQPVLLDSPAAAKHLGGGSDRPNEARQIVFTGPVFFGYSAKNAAELIRSLQQGS